MDFDFCLDFDFDLDVAIDFDIRFDFGLSTTLWLGDTSPPSSLFTSSSIPLPPALFGSICADKDECGGNDNGEEPGDEADEDPDEVEDEDDDPADEVDGGEGGTTVTVGRAACCTPMSRCFHS